MEPDEINDIELATQLSLLDLNVKGKKHGEVFADEDEELARAIKESLRSSSNSKQIRSWSTSIGSSSTIDCDVCNKALSPGMNYCNPEFWNQRFCYNHFSDGTPVCCGCVRLKRSDLEYFDLGDGRTICGDCYSTSIKCTQQIEPLLNNVLQFFKEKGMEIQEQVPVFLVTRMEMSRHTSQGTSLGHVHPNATIFGLTHVTSSSLRGRQVILEEKDYEVTGCKATIMVLYGLPMCMTGGVLAHEMMHAWLGIQGIRRLEPKIAEGICQVMGHEWLDWFESKDPQGSYSSIEEAQYARNLKKAYKHLVEVDSSRAYGDGFRDAKHSVAKYGLRNVINHIRRYRTLPN
ncbi:protein da1-related 1 [Citrus sinensis]|uniref:Protein da1-related 1 n=1 Tax=Citrus sinensis TaxID=2711 RepID=A0ACB8IFW9_CITSI|nr:protein da1-related 1 [Citrus sinensis]